ncbi:MAG: molybdopterin molybdenumtransferase MoeA, partial [Nitrospirota bacterium]|nr:molybdopterin molybdenumtransferase MoeA [Nitrospirota bacterium]
MQGLTPLHEAQKIVLAATQILGLEKVGLVESLGRVIGEDLIALRDNPPWDNSAMDGFAVRYEDIKQDHAIAKPVVL